ncbi:MAG: tetratricopeptide repeat protein [Anaeromyxobacteraceae bacterium]
MPGPSRAASPRARPATALATPAIAAGLAAVAFALFARTGAHGFLLWDDQAYVTGNARVLGGLSRESAAWALTTFHHANWHPLTWLSFLLDASLSGAAPGAMHLENAALHAANAALVFLALLRLTGARWRSALVAALFAVHPTRVEAVAWVSERKELLSTLFGLLAILAHAAYARRPSAWRYALVVAAAAASLASKAMLVTLPFLLLGLDAWPLDRLRAGGWRRALLEKVPLLALSAGCAALTYAAQARGGGIPAVALPFGERLAGAVVAPVRYAGLLAWPSGLSALYPLRDGGPPPWQVAGAAVLVAGALAAAFALRGRAPWFAVGLCGFLGTLVPVVGLVQVGAQALADRYTYFPALGLFLVVAWGAAALARGPARGAVVAAAVAALVALSAVTWQRIALWGDEVALFQDALAATGENGRASTLLALALLHRGRAGEALAPAADGTRLAPGDAMGWLALGLAARDTGRDEEALRGLREAVKRAPDLRQAWAALAGALSQAGRSAEAVEAFRAYLALAPRDADAWALLVWELARLERYAEAREAYERLQAIDAAAAARLRRELGGR